MSPDLYASLPEPARRDWEYWSGLIRPLIGPQAPQRGIHRHLRALATSTGHPYATIQRKYYAARQGGLEALLNRRLIGPTAYTTTTRRNLSPQDIDTLKTYCESNGRKSLPAIRAMLRDWREGRLHTDTPTNPATGYPHGWSETNLMRHLPSRFELTAARIGRTAAANERRLVYTTRTDLYVGSHYLFDDIWHDHFVNVLDQRKTGRPLEFHCIDLYSACKFAWGISVRLENDGRMESLKEADMRFLLAATLSTHGYSPRGTTLVAEHGTAAIPTWLEELLHTETGGLITVARSGMEGAAAAAHQYAGRPKGNFRFKAALESLGNLIHNEMATLPGQTGPDRNRRPEQLDGLLRRNDALLTALAQLHPDRAAMLHWPLLTIQQFRSIASEIYDRINARTDHRLEGWDLLMRPDPRTGTMRRLSPTEVWRTGRPHLTTIRPTCVAAILVRDQGTEITNRRGILELTLSELSGDPLRYDAHHLTDREKYRIVINPYDPTYAYAFDAKNRFIATCPRIHSIDRADLEAIHRECGAAAKIEAQRLAPFRARHTAAARQKAASMRHNAALLNGDPITPQEIATAKETAHLARTIGADAATDMLAQPTTTHTTPTTTETEIPW